MSGRALLGTVVAWSAACGPGYPVPDVGSAEGVVTVGVTATTVTDSLAAEVAAVPADFFVGPSGAWLGRLLTPSDFDPDARPVAVLTHDLWTRLGEDPGLIGARLEVGAQTRIVVGVTPPGFRVPDGVDIWVPR